MKSLQESLRVTEVCVYEHKHFFIMFMSSKFFNMAIINIHFFIAINIRSIIIFEAVLVILSNITAITTIHTQACGKTVGDSTWPSEGVSGAAAALARSATLTARRSASSCPTLQESPHKHACTVSAHAETTAESSETAPCPLTRSLARRQPWRVVRH